eukprot:11586294-Alexandrium_andersonii.AAC.1
MSASLVGSEMCIRDRGEMPPPCLKTAEHKLKRGGKRLEVVADSAERVSGCLLYTSDAADDM